MHLIYLPLYGSKSGKTTAELLDKAIKLTPLVAKDNVAKKRKLQDLIFLLTSTFVSEDEINKVMEANMINLETNRYVKVLTDIAEKALTDIVERRKVAEIATIMLRKGNNMQDISEITGLSIDQVIELQTELQSGQAV